MAVSPPYLNLVLQETLEDTFLAGAAIAQYSRVKYTSSGTILAANAADLSIGTARSAIANAAYGVVRLDMPQQYGLSNTLINIGDTVYSADGGFVSAVLVNNAIQGVAKIGAPAPAANTGNNQSTCVFFGVRKSAI